MAIQGVVASRPNERRDDVAQLREVRIWKQARHVQRRMQSVIYPRSIDYRSMQ